MFFAGWDSVARIVVLATFIYAILIAALRVIGEQALARSDAGDLSAFKDLELPGR